MVQFSKTHKVIHHFETRGATRKFPSQRFYLVFVCVNAQVCVCIGGGQRSTLGVIFQVPSTLFFETVSQKSHTHAKILQGCFTRCVILGSWSVAGPEPNYPGLS